MTIRYNQLSKKKTQGLRAKLTRERKEQEEFDAETERLVREVQRINAQKAKRERDN